ncbi:GRM8 [Symbiodinium natans]|uniref:GRM8 protein n=1 Tax=Symbiodinium natans TaxID=878477 RepID=A0A812N5N0_9DINO|nr:GRM8 [Symbiodinium natans]
MGSLADPCNMKEGKGRHAETQATERLADPSSMKGDNVRRGETKTSEDPEDLSNVKGSLNSLTAASITSQLIMSIQALSSIRELSIQWQEPVKTALDLTKVMTFDVRILRITCIYGTDSPLLHFASQLLACPAACTFLLLAWLLSKMAGRPRSFNAVVHKCGVLVFAFFLSITRSTLIPFQCSPSPNGSTSMVTDPGIICYESNEHTALIVLAVAGILTQSAAFLAWATFITMMYPSHVASGRGIVFANRYRFFFNRFKPEKYYYGVLARSLVLVYRSAFVALLPIVLVGLPELQVPVMGGILLLVNDLQAHMWPWRTSSANLVDLILTAFLVLVLLGAGPLLVLDSEQSVSVLGWLLCIPVFGTLIVAVVGLARAVVKDLLQRQKRLFGVYLCHHKGGSGSLCRLIKILIAKHSSTRVFLDSDNLENLDYLFDIVRTSTSSVVVVMTPELPKRIWCAGEIVTAWKNRITTVPLICEGFEPLSDESQKLIPTLWTPQEKQNLANLGVQVKDVSAAYVWLQHELTPVKMPRFGQVRCTNCSDCFNKCSHTPC